GENGQKRLQVRDMKGDYQLVAIVGGDSRLTTVHKVVDISGAADGANAIFDSSQTSMAGGVIFHNTIRLRTTDTVSEISDCFTQHGMGTVPIVQPNRITQFSEKLRSLRKAVLG
ncbi:MAG: hypothetical protein ACPG05_05500, partial [Bdellovibrionales bacterium]